MLPALVLAASCGFECLVVADARFDPEPRIMEVVHVSLLMRALVGNGRLGGFKAAMQRD